MAHGLTVHLLIGVLLACPFPCLARAAANGSAQLGKPVLACADGCCCDPGAKPPQQGPVAPARNAAGTCLCQGAVMDRMVLAPLPELQCIGVPADDERLLHERLIASLHAAWLLPAACDFAAAYSGRILRAHIASLLL